MRLAKSLFVLGTAILLAGVVFHAAVLTADGGRPAPRPPSVAGQPSPVNAPVFVADGGRPAPRPPSFAPMAS